MANVYNIGGDPLVPDIPYALTYKRNSLTNVAEFLAVGESYVGKTAITYNDGNTPIYLNTATNGIDCSTFVILCLLGLPWSKSPYVTGQYGPSALDANTEDYDWAINPMKYAISRYIDGSNPTEMVRLACQLGHWMYDRGQEISLGNGFADVRPGDIVFWAHKASGSTDWYRPTWWEHINHVGIVYSKEDAPNTYVDGQGVTRNWDKTKYPYKHVIMDCGGTTPPCRTTHWLEEGQEDPTNVYVNNVNTIALICRPDFGAL